MPGYDGTGPLGQGPMTGRGMGLCAGGDRYNKPGFFGRWFGRRFGFGRGFRAGRGMGFGRGARAGRGRGWRLW